MPAVLDDPRQRRKLLPDVWSPDRRRAALSAAAGHQCEACGGALVERQRWCMACGAGTLTRIATTRHWRSAAAVAVAVGALALAGVGYAVATLLSS
jgi:hypothetical protein